MDEKKNEIILFENQGVKLEVNLKDETRYDNFCSVSCKITKWYFI